MNRTLIIYLGILSTVMFSSLGLVFIPDNLLFNLKPVKDDQGNLRPIELWGAAAEGREIYISMGCIYCHSQQVRPEGFGADIERGWGSRRSLAVDYIYDSPHLLGTMRTGPDLLNIGARQPDENWHYQHLYAPTLTSPGSIMAPFPFLFEMRTLDPPGSQPPADAVRMPTGSLPEGRYIVPTQRAKALVTYLKSLSRGYDVPGVIQ